MKHQYLLGIFDDEEPLLKATSKIRQEGYQMHEIYTPFPVHGLDHAMGLQETRLHTAGFVAGACGTLFAISMMGWISASSWPIMIGGKPFFAAPSYVPITFELTVLFASVGMVIMFYLRNGFSVFKETEVVDPRITDDRFVMAFCGKKYESADDIAKITSLLNANGAIEVRERFMETEIPANLLKEHDDSDEDHGHHH